MKEAGVILILRACAGLAAAAAVLFCAAGCLKVTGYEDKKDPIPLRDVGDDVVDGMDADGDEADMDVLEEGDDLPQEDIPDVPAEDTELPDMPDAEDIPDVPAEDAELPDMPDAEDIPDVLVEPDAGDWIDIEDVPAEPDAPDVAELPPGLVWVSIPSGAFEMGCSPGDADCDDNEKPRHTVNVSAFRMTETEITQAQYEWVTGSNPSYLPGCPDCPVEQVTWFEAKGFCGAIGARLPSEAEWEYAARAGTTTRYYCGDDAACVDAVAWYNDNSGSLTHPVGEKTANTFGLYDMLGNVWEWVEDCWHSDHTGAPSTGEVWRGGDCVYRVSRGGAYNYFTWGMTASFRFRIVPDTRSKYFGFRCSQ